MLKKQTIIRVGSCFFKIHALYYTVNCTNASHFQPANADTSSAFEAFYGNTGCREKLLAPFY